MEDVVSRLREFIEDVAVMGMQDGRRMMEDGRWKNYP